VTKATTGATPSAKTSASHATTAKASAKPKTSSKKTAAVPSASLLTVPAGWKLAFDPSFSGTQLDTSTWATCYDWATNPSVGGDDNPTDEKEWYVPSQVNVSGGDLNLVATQESTQGLSTSGAPKTFTCRSGMVTSKPAFNFTYGLANVADDSTAAGACTGTMQIQSVKVYEP
jgi:beta-glucanase (GH16 family)